MERLNRHVDANTWSDDVGGWEISADEVTENTVSHDIIDDLNLGADPKNLGFSLMGDDGESEYWVRAVTKTIIESNGTEGDGEYPDSIEHLLEVLDEHPLNRTFENYGNFIIIKDDGYKRFFGNFYRHSHVFNILTNEPKIIATLTRAIRGNQKRSDYLSQDLHAHVFRESRSNATVLVCDYCGNETSLEVPSV